MYLPRQRSRLGCSASKGVPSARQIPHCPGPKRFPRVGRAVCSLTVHDGPASRPPDPFLVGVAAAKKTYEGVPAWEHPFHGSRQQSAAEPRLRMGGASRFSVHTGGQLERKVIMVYAKLSTHCFRSTFNLARREYASSRVVFHSPSEIGSTSHSKAMSRRMRR